MVIPQPGDAYASLRNFRLNTRDIPHQCDTEIISANAVWGQVYGLPTNMPSELPHLGAFVSSNLCLLVEQSSEKAGESGSVSFLAALRHHVIQEFQGVPDVANAPSRFPPVVRIAMSQNANPRILLTTDSFYVAANLGVSRSASCFENSEVREAIKDLVPRVDPSKLVGSEVRVSLDFFRARTEQVAMGHAD